MRRTLTVACALAMTLLAAPAAHAHFEWHRDARDPVTHDDVVGVRLSTFRQDGTRMLKANVDFATHGVDDPSVYSITFVFDSRGDGGADYVLGISYDVADGGIFDLSFERVGQGPVAIRIFTTVELQDVDGLPAWFRLAELRPTKHIRWRVETGTDRAPDRGWFRH